MAQNRGDGAYQTILYYWGNALRESWEEIRLSAFNVDFLGPLPLTGCSRAGGLFFPGWTGAREMDLPAESGSRKNCADFVGRLLSPGELRVYSLEIPRKWPRRAFRTLGFPLPHRGREGEEEVLWGATFQIIQTFLKIVFPFPLPPPGGQRVIRRPSCEPTSRGILFLNPSFYYAFVKAPFGMEGDEKNI